MPAKTNPVKDDDPAPIDREAIERDLTRRVIEWAETWRKCPRKGCRRNAVCLDPDDCRGMGRGAPTEWTDQDRKTIRAALNQELARRARDA
jgi:hypothetical protein